MPMLMSPTLLAIRTPFLLVVLGGLVALLGGCSSAETAGAPEITVLSTRSDMVTGGDALVRIDLPSGVSVDRVTVESDGQDVTTRIREVEGDSRGSLSI